MINFLQLLYCHIQPLTLLQIEKKGKVRLWRDEGRIEEFR
jgi:hypothetical protein